MIFSSKPNIDPPHDLDEPDFSELMELIEKHEEVASRLANTEIGGSKSWVEIREHIKRIVNIQLSAIANFLDRHFYLNDQEKVELYQTRIHQYSNFAASAGWVIGREWGFKDPILREKLEKAKTVELTDLPEKAIDLLRLAIFDIYSVFYFPHKFYYESRYQGF